ncbi:MAG: hypothetical protein DYG88_00180 [Chloroflexi bacterium CFX4]|nr:hypothetical protein [Chloroflexi bacterium CFX4]MDL1921684.1 hypothetical protein [Chloroflexi bacterium CFX3]
MSQNAIIPMPEAAQHPPALESLRGLLLLAFMGAALALLALTLMQWRSPRGEDAAWVTMTHPQRLVLRLEQRDTGGLVSDALIYPVLLIGVGSAAVAWRRGRRGALIGVMLMALLGMGYAGSMALYNGAMVAVCGFSLMLFSGLVAFSLALAANPPPLEVPTPEDAPPASLLEEHAELAKTDTDNTDNDELGGEGL